MPTSVTFRQTSPLAEEFWQSGRCAACPVIDAHAHMGYWQSIYFPRPQAAGMVQAMDAAGVRLACFAHHAALFAPEIGNDPAVEAVRQFPDRLRAYLCVNPHYGDLLDRDLRRFDALRDVFIGMKFLASYHKVPITDDRYRPALEFASQRRLPILLHTWGGSSFDGPPHVRELAGKYPQVTFLLGHSLFGQWEQAVAVAREFPNTYLELCAVLGVRGILEQFVARAGSDRLLYGTDLPWFDEHQAIGAVMLADITDADRHNILHRNARRLLSVLPGFPDAA